ncbi:CpsB/CapC family capsule biosynthesis tyrosine phosphatase [Bacillus sp. 165]|uniref:tyrosine-protein phosphatase n=1 Tax=Bacillus sp. 165 TaxID=1529117 RepID=UPI001ADB194E|nr:CpsB/CapC family capsule biosynthesis tyrosine phosphatase [Bacillus sp. 165]MBO9130032.1 tyrosine protein phosphatase [Bacillus sp. 165]
MIDLHCHILPDIDDGPKNIEESLLMAQEAAAKGIRTIVATPHRNAKYKSEVQEILYKVKMLNEQLNQQNIPLNVVPGQEIRLYGEIVPDIMNQSLLTINGANKHIFIEFPSDHVPRYAERLLYEIQLQGIIPVVVHPERNAEIAEQPSLLYNLIKKGALSQITAASVTGAFGKNIKKLSLQLIEHNLTQMIASDAHNTTNRSFALSEAYSVIEKEFGHGIVSDFQENTYFLLEGQSVYKPAPERIRKKKLFGIF